MTEQTSHAGAPRAGEAEAGAAITVSELRKNWQALRAWLRSDAAPRWILLGILVVAGLLRLTNLNWDDFTHIHPDERFLTMVTAAMRLPDSLGQFFDSTQSPMSPYNIGYDFFVYGTLPLFIVRVVAEFAQKLNASLQLWSTVQGIPIVLTGFDGVHLVGRFVSGVFDLGCVWVTYLIARRLYSVRVGLLAATLYAFAVLPLQQSHFYTVDTFGTFFALVTFYFCVRVAQGGGWWHYLAMGLGLGASLACRINLAPLAGIGLLAAGIHLWEELFAHRRAAAAGTPEDRGWTSMLVQATLFRLALFGLATIIIFRIAQPYAFSGTSVMSFSFAEKFRANMRDIQLLISGAQDYPPGHQWTSRTPFVFPFVNMIVWGLGVFLGLAGWIGWLVAAYQILVALTIKGRQSAPDARS
ncbi:MAG: ArnT family glycosyltransferase, partial [Nitrososphaerales archaeon]